MLTRLAVGIVEREDDDVTMGKLDKSLAELVEKKVKFIFVCQVCEGSITSYCSALYTTKVQRRDA